MEKVNFSQNRTYAKPQNTVLPGKIRARYPAHFASVMLRTRFLRSTHLDAVFQELVDLLIRTDWTEYAPVFGQFGAPVPDIYGNDQML